MTDNSQIVLIHILHDTLQFLAQADGLNMKDTQLRQSTGTSKVADNTLSISIYLIRDELNS